VSRGCVLSPPAGVVDTGRSTDPTADADWEDAFLNALRLTFALPRAVVAPRDWI
jgi:hypothetical protein